MLAETEHACTDRHRNVMLPASVGRLMESLKREDAAMAHKDYFSSTFFFFFVSCQISDVIRSKSLAHHGP